MRKRKIRNCGRGKIETVCEIKILKQVLKRLREVHSYEEPAINIIPLIDEESI